MKTAILMYERRYFTPFVKKVCGLLNVDYIFWLYDSEVENLQAENIESQCNIMKIDKILERDFDRSLRLVVFDLHLIPAIAGMRWTLKNVKKYNATLEIVYIQHGTFNDLSSDKRVNVGVKWLAKSLFGFLIFIRTIHPKFIWDFISLTFMSFRYGSFQVRAKLFKYIPVIDHGIFWNRGDIEILGDDFLRVVRRITICQSPDQERVDLQRDPTGPKLYVAQPLVEDGLVPLDTMSSFLSKLAGRDDVLFLVHPRSNLELFKDIPTGKLLRLNQLKELKVSGVIGHFSSFLVSVPASVPLQLEDLGLADVAKSVQSFLASRQTKDSRRTDPSFSEALKRLEL